MQPQRELSIDIAKGIGIILVVFGHTVAIWGGSHEILHKFVYSFHMPLFFSLSGIYVSTKSNLITFIKSKVIRFVIPFLFWVTFYFLLYTVLRIAKLSVQDFINVNNEVTAVLDLQTLKSLCLVPIAANWSSINNAGVYIDLWFLPAIFSTVILYRILSEITSNLRMFVTLFITVLFSAIVVYLNNRYGFHSSIPWSIDVAIVCLPFLIISRYRFYIKQLHWIAIPLLFFAIYFLSKDMTVEVAGLVIENYPKFFITATFGIVLVFLISVKLQSFWVGRILSSIGKRTYTIFVLQGVAFTFFKPVLSRLPILGTNEIIFDYTLFLTTLAFGYLLHPLIEKYKFFRLFASGQERRRSIQAV